MLIYTHSNPLMVGHIRGLLEAAGIEVELRNQFAIGAVGELSPVDAWPEVWLLHEEDGERAKLIVETAISDSSCPDWHCPGCQEHNGAAFDICWCCGVGRPLKPALE